MATANYLWYADRHNSCHAHNRWDPWGQGRVIDVNNRFGIILKLWWVYAVTDFFRSLVAIVATFYSSKLLAYFYQFLMVNDGFGICAIIILHVYRFQSSGKECSGDFLASSEPQAGYLIDRGKYLLGLVIYVWVALFTYGCIMGCILTAAKRRDKQTLKKMPIK